MTLGEIIREYRKSQEMSQRKFAEKSGLSNSYISMLEMNMNGKNGKPIKPTLEVVKTVADAMGVSMEDVLRRMDDLEIDISGNSFYDELDMADIEIIRIVHRLPQDAKRALRDFLMLSVGGSAD